MGTRPVHDPAYRRLCRLLREWREAEGLTQRDLSKALRKKHHTLIHKIETGDRRIDPVEFARWCRACKVDPRDGIEQVLR